RARTSTSSFTRLAGPSTRLGYCAETVAGVLRRPHMTYLSVTVSVEQLAQAAALCHRMRPQLGQRVMPAPFLAFCSTWIGSFTLQPPQLELSTISTTPRPRRAVRIWSYCLSSGASI